MTRTIANISAAIVSFGVSIAAFQELKTPALNAMPRSIGYLVTLAFVGGLCFGFLFLSRILIQKR